MSTHVLEQVDSSRHLNVHVVQELRAEAVGELSDECGIPYRLMGPLVLKVAADAACEPVGHVVLA